VSTALSAAERAALIRRRKVEYAAANPGCPDFSYNTGECRQCGADLVAYYGDKYPTVMITGCPRCHSSYCD
jgi:hypothetical protein